MEPSPHQLLLSVPVALPNADALRALLFDAMVAAAKQQLCWLTDREARAFLGGCSASTWERKRKAFGIPCADLDGRRMYLRADLEALLLAHTSAPGTTVIAFPSKTLRDQRAKAAA